MKSAYAFSAETRRYKVSLFFGPRKWVFIRSQSFFWCEKWVAIRSNNFKFSQKWVVIRSPGGFVSDLITTPCERINRFYWIEVRGSILSGYLIARRKVPIPGKKFRDISKIKTRFPGILHNSGIAGISGSRFWYFRYFQPGSLPREYP